MTAMTRGSWALGCVLCLAAGCATAPTTLQTARTTEKGEFRFHAGASVPISTRFVAEVADLVDGATARAEDARTAGRELTPEEERDLMEASLGLILFTPAPTFELGARYGIVDDLDVGFEWAGPMLRGDAKVRLYEDPGSVDLGAMLGYTYHTSTAPSILEEVQDLFDFVFVIDYARHDLDLTLLANGDVGQTVTWYASLRYLAGIISADVAVGFDRSAAAPFEIDTILHLVGGTGGLRVGTEKLEFMLELTVAYIHLEPEVNGDTLGLSGMLFMPAIGLSFETG